MRAALPFLLLLLGAASAPAADDPCRDAALALRDGRLRAAQGLVAEASDAAPDRADLHRLTAEILIALDKGAAAEAELDRAAAGGLPAASLLALRAHAQLLQDRPDRALDLAATPGADPVRAARVRALALAALDDGDAGAAFAHAVALAPRDAVLRTDLARFRRRNGDVAGAVIAGNEAVAIAPAHPQTLLLKGELARDQYGLAAALPWFDRALAREPKMLAARIQRGATLGEMGRYRAMLADTRVALALDRGNPDALFQQAVLAARARQFGLARRILQRAGDRLDDSPAASLLSGILDERGGALTQATDTLTELLEDQPGNVKVRRLLAMVRWRADDPQAVVDLLAPIAAEPLADAYDLALLGRAEERLGAAGAAAQMLDRASRPGRAAPLPALDPGLIRALRREATTEGGADRRIALVRTLLRAGQAAEALPEAVALRDADPGTPAPHLVLGDTLDALGRPLEAAESYRRAANMSFTEPVALRLVAALRRGGQPAAASQVLALYLSENPQSLPARRLEADLLIAVRDWKQAIPRLERLDRRLAHRDVALLNNLAWGYLVTRQPARALAAADRAWRLAPGNPAIASTFGWMLHATGSSPVKGLALLDQASAMAPDSPTVRWRLAQAYAAQGRPREARAALFALLGNPAFQDRAAAAALLARL